MAEVWARQSNERLNVTSEESQHATKHRFEVYRDRAGEYRVRFKYNGEVLFSTAGYASLASAINVIESIKKNGPRAPVEDSTI